MTSSRMNYLTLHCEESKSLFENTSCTIITHTIIPSSSFLSISAVIWDRFKNQTPRHVLSFYGSYPRQSLMMCLLSVWFLLNRSRPDVRIHHHDIIFQDEWPTIHLHDWSSNCCSCTQNDQWCYQHIVYINIYIIIIILLLFTWTVGLGQFLKLNGSNRRSDNFTSLYFRHIEAQESLLWPDKGTETFSHLQNRIDTQVIIENQKTVEFLRKKNRQWQFKDTCNLNLFNNQI